MNVLAGQCGRLLILGAQSCDFTPRFSFPAIHQVLGRGGVVEPGSSPSREPAAPSKADRQSPRPSGFSLLRWWSTRGWETWSTELPAKRAVVCQPHSGQGQVSPHPSLDAAGLRSPTLTCIQFSANILTHKATKTDTPPVFLYVRIEKN